MTHEQFDREKNYRVALTIAKSMFKLGLITDLEYRQIDKFLIGKYSPVIGGLCS